MFFDQKDLKSKFLQKKNKQKKKVQQNQKQNTQATLIQKNIRAFINRQKFKSIIQQTHNLKSLLLLNIPLNNVNINDIKLFSKQLLKVIQSQSIQNSDNNSNEVKLSQKVFYLTKLFFSLIQYPLTMTIGYDLIQQIEKRNKKVLNYLVGNQKFIKVFDKMFSHESINKLLNLTIHSLQSQQIITKLSQNKLLETVISQFSSQKMQIQNSFYENLKIQTIYQIIFNLSNINYQHDEYNFKQFQPISSLTIFIIDSCHQQIGIQKVLSFLIQILLHTADKQRKLYVEQITNQYLNLYNLVEDQEDLIYFQNKIMAHGKMENFSSIVLKTMQNIFEKKLIIQLFNKKSTDVNSKIIKQTIVKAIKLLSKSFQDRKIIFLRNMLSSDELLIELFNSKSDEFYQGLKMKLMAMDDQDFKRFNLFNQKQWQDIVQTAIHKSFKIIKNQASNPNYNKKKLIPFQTKDQQNLILNRLSQTLQNLYKKSLRTKKLHQQIFISQQFTKDFQTFNFGTGAIAIQKLLKLYPFCFTFYTRLDKFKKQIKQDKKNHDRTLFLQQQPDPDLIITVRRGYEFLDAFQQCIDKDLRKKYKLVFFNEQGLQEEGIDGGGLIKEFINRVLKSAFSEVYGLFQQNSQHEIIPNPYSPSTLQYEFIGKLIGKAIYQGISIQQKFVQPFLNLVIGRKNTFQDIQYIDPHIYKSLIDIKHMGVQIQDLQQTFTILDQQPNGVKKYINLLCPSKQVNGDDNTFVTNENKLQFIMAYSDFKCNKQFQQKTRYFRKGFLKILKAQWLTLFNNQQLNQIISGGSADFNVNQLKNNCVYTDYHEKSITIVYFWEILTQFTAQQKSLFLLYVTSCSRPPTLGFGSLKPKLCISRDQNTNHLPTANTCMNVLRLPDYKNKETLRQKLLYAINSKAGFEFA